MRFLDPLAQKGAKNTIKSRTSAFSGSLFLPEDEDEQRKIAGCLGSLDDLIAAEDRKLEALRQHRQGLMQQLFPTRGQAVPRRRFSGCEAADWEPVRLGDAGVFIRGLTYSTSDVAEKGLFVIRSSNIQQHRLVLDADLVFVDKECAPDLILRTGDVAICMSNGSKALVGKSAEYHGDYSGNVTVGAFCSIFRPSLPFARLAFGTPQYDRLVAVGLAGGSINNLKNSDLEDLEWAVPVDPIEQAAIIDCLEALDAALEGQRRCCETLRRHKTGLLQQLFPSPEEESR